MQLTAVRWLCFIWWAAHTHRVTHTHTRMGCNCDRDRRKSVSEMSEKCFASCRVSLAAKSNEYKQSVHSGEGPRGLHEEFLANTWHVAEIVAEGIVCAPGTLPFCSAPLRQRKLSVCSAKCCDLCAASRFLVQSNVHYFVHTDTVYICFEYHSTTPSPPSLSYSLLASFLPSVSECGCDPGAKCKMRLMQQFLLQNRISSGNVVQQCINWWQEIIES